MVLGKIESWFPVAFLPVFFMETPSPASMSFPVRPSSSLVQVCGVGLYRRRFGHPPRTLLLQPADTGHKMILCPCDCRIDHYEERLKALFFKKNYSERMSTIIPRIKGYQFSPLSSYYLLAIYISSSKTASQVIEKQLLKEQHRNWLSVSNCDLPIA